MRTFRGVPPRVRAEGVDEAWRGGPAAEVRLADEATWERLKAEVECVVIRDAGYTQVAAGTETVPPRQAQPLLVTEFERLA